MFARRHLVVELAPHFYGQEPRVLDAVIARALADPEVVPLVGVAGARDQVYSLASVLACETAIAESLGRHVARSDGRSVVPDVVAAAIASAEARVGGRLSDGQRQAAEAICTSGRGAELVVGVAGSGKTTMLSVVTAAFERSGHLVIGTATSGQAARTLGKEASIGEPRTLTSLVWRLDQGQLHLDDRSVVILDEVGMTDDAALIRLTGYVEAARAKLVLVGDDRQLGAVGPGGALGALIARHPTAVHYLVENRRQTDLGERQALQDLRGGSVARSLAWYVDHERVHAVADRHDALDAAVDAWAADVTAGHETGLYAWRRTNVAELNTRARTWMDQTGRLTGPELDCGSGNRFRAGDQVVALAPNHTVGLVTSQRATVESVDLHAGTLTLRSADDQPVLLATGDAGADRLGYGYATTVHRAQGATVDRAHLLADGGGRELAYVAMSRARSGTHAWVVADHLDQAIEDLRDDWTDQKRPRWAIDTGLPDPNTARRDDLTALPDVQRATVVALAAAQYRHTADQLAGLRPPDLRAAIDGTTGVLEQAFQARADLASGAGLYHDSEAGGAVRDLTQARDHRQRAQHVAEHGDRRRDRHSAARKAHYWAAREADAEARWHTYVIPEAARLDNQIARHQRSLDRLNERQHDLAQAGQRVQAHGANAGKAARQLGAQLDDRYRADLDGVPPRRRDPGGAPAVPPHKPADNGAHTASRTRPLGPAQPRSRSVKPPFIHYSSSAPAACTSERFDLSARNSSVNRTGPSGTMSYSTPGGMACAVPGSSSTWMGGSVAARNRSRPVRTEIRPQVPGAPWRFSRSPDAKVVSSHSMLRIGSTVTGSSARSHNRHGNGVPRRAFLVLPSRIHSRHWKGGRCRTCWRCPHSNCATQSPISSRR